MSYIYISLYRSIYWIVMIDNDDKYPCYNLLFNYRNCINNTSNIQRKEKNNLLTDNL